MSENKFMEIKISEREFLNIGNSDLIKVKNDILDDMIGRIKLDMNKKKGEKLKLNEFITNYDKENGIYSFILKYNY